MNRRFLLIVAGAMLGLLNVGAMADLSDSPIFTPVHLVEQAEYVAVVKLSPGEKAGLLKAEVVEMLKKGKVEIGAPIVIDLAAAIHKEQADRVLAQVRKSPDAVAIVFLGDDRDPILPGGGAGPPWPDGFLHFNGRWVSLYRAKAGGLEMDRCEDKMQYTWAGGTDMLIRAVRYVLKAKNEAVLPVNVEASWEKNESVGKIPGKAFAAMAVDLLGPKDFRQHLFVASDAGDRLFLFDPKAEKMLDVTGRHGLVSKSCLACWADLNRDGRLDLASWDGKALTIYLQDAEAKFRAEPVEIDAKILDKGLIGMTLLGIEHDGGVGLLLTTPAGPVLLKKTAAGKWEAERLPDPPSATQPADELKRPAPCVVADLDGDGLPDVLAPHGNGSLLYRGLGPGRFDRPTRCAIAIGEGPGRAAVGDFDQDGLLDVFTVSAGGLEQDEKGYYKGPGPRLWQNLGGGRFEDKIAQSGAVAYIPKPDAREVHVFNISGDGLAGLLIAYPHNPPHMFFNRGFRSLDHAHSPVDIEETQSPGCDQGCQAVCVGDFNGDCAPDMALVLTDGSLVVYYRKVFEGDPALGIRFACPTGKGFAGPAVVRVSDAVRDCGVWHVPAGGSAFIGLRSPGRYVVNWQLPGGKPQEKKVQLRDQAIHMIVE